MKVSSARSMDRYMPFQTDKGKWYVYDGMTSKIYSVGSKQIESIGKNLCSELISETLSGGKELDLVESRWPYTFEEYREKVQTNIENMVLQITCKCNLNCTYCVYSGNYRHMKEHSNDHMSLDVIKQSIDFFSRHCGEAKEPAITFYGGEALLLFSSVKEAVQYARSVIVNPGLHFRISSNGTTVTRDVARWLKENRDVSIYVTLNGYQHDKYRKHSSGAGSLADILKNIDMIKAEFPVVWENQIQFISNISSEHEVLPLNEFFKRLGKAPEVINKIRPNMGNSIINSIVEPYEDTERDQLEKILLETKDPFIKTAIGRGVDLIDGRPLFQECENAYVGMCCPGMNRLFVRWNGEFNICERVSDSICIGNIESGFDWEYLYTLYCQTRQFVNDNCLNCWGQRLCTVCYQDLIGEDGKMAKAPDTEICRSHLNDLERSIRLFCEMNT